MPQDFKVGVAARNAAMDSITALIDVDASAGKFRAYGGTIPAGPTTDNSGAPWFGDATLGDPAFDGASDGEASLSTTPTITHGASPTYAQGEATYFRVSDGADVPIMQGSIGDAQDAPVDFQVNVKNWFDGASTMIDEIVLSFPE